MSGNSNKKEISDADGAENSPMNDTPKGLPLTRAHVAQIFPKFPLGTEITGAISCLHCFTAKK